MKAKAESHPQTEENSKPVEAEEQRPGEHRHLNDSLENRSVKSERVWPEEYIPRRPEP
jgi:hypothetical protein